MRRAPSTGAAATAFEIVVSDEMHLATATSLADLAGFFVRLSRVRDLLCLENPSSALGLELALETAPGELSDGVSRGLSVFLDLPRLHPHPDLLAGALPNPTHKNSLMTGIRTRGESFVTLAHLNASGSLEVLYPLPVELAQEGAEGFFDARGRAEGGTWLRLPPALDPTICWPQIGEPPGLANLWAFATDDEALAREVRAYLAERSEDPDGAFDTARMALLELREACARAARERGADWDVSLQNYILEN